MNNTSAQIFRDRLTTQNIFGNGVTKMNIDGNWLQLGTQSIFDRLAGKRDPNPKFPWELTQDAWLRQENTGFIPSSAYSETYSMKEEKDLNEYPILVDRKNFAGKTIEFRQQDMRNLYVNHDDNDEIIRDEQGMAIYLTDEEMAKRDLQPKDTTIYIFDGNLKIGHIGDSFGATELFVDKDYQKQGIGTHAMKLYLTRYPTHSHKPRHLGQMTNAGENTARKVHRQLIEQARQEGKQIPPEVLQEYDLS